MYKLKYMEGNFLQLLPTDLTTITVCMHLYTHIDTIYIFVILCIYILTHL